MRYVGRRWDYDEFAPPWGTTLRMPAYTTFRVAAAWKATDRIEIFGRVENLFNKKYQDVAGFGTPGIGVFGGVGVKF